MTYPQPQCIHNDSHHFKQIATASEIFMCKQCGIAKWQPISMYAALQFGNSIHKNGLHIAYMRELDSHPWIRGIINQINNGRK